MNIPIVQNLMYVEKHCFFNNMAIRFLAKLLKVHRVLYKNRFIM